MSGLKMVIQVLLESHSSNQGCYKCFLPMKNCHLCPVKNYAILKFMLPAVATITNVPCASPVNSPALKIYCYYFVCAADAQSVCDS